MTTGTDLDLTDGTTADQPPLDGTDIPALHRAKVSIGSVTIRRDGDPLKIGDHVALIVVGEIVEDGRATDKDGRIFKAKVDAQSTTVREISAADAARLLQGRFS